MDPQAYLDCLDQTSDRDGFERSDLQSAAAMDISMVEQELSRTLCVDYQSFLLTAGCGPVFGGLAHWLHLDVGMPGNLLAFSQHLADDMRATPAENPFPTGFLAIYDACDGDVMGFLPDEHHNHYKPAVYAWNTEDLDVRLVADTFNGFLAALMAECHEPGNELELAA